MQSHMKKRWSLVAATLVVGFGTGMIHHAAQADSSHDCSSLKKWSSDATYKKGELVWHPDGASYAKKHQCILEKCQGLKNNGEPGVFSKSWNQIGNCKSRPSR
mgnify:CR=1 FL=1